MKGPRASSQRAGGEALADYISHYAGRVTRLIADNQCVLLHGPLGVGKSDVLKRAASRIEQRKLARCIILDIAKEGSALQTPSLLLVIAQTLEPGRFTEAALERPHIESELRFWLRNWLQDTGMRVVLLIDHVEQLSRSREIFQLLRALNQSADVGQDIGSDDGAPSAGSFVFVLASAQTLRQKLLSPISPISNILNEIDMADCDPEMRMHYWRAQLRGLSNADRDALIDELDVLCGGDPYVMQRVARQIRSSRERLSEISTSEDAAQAVRHALERIQHNPAAVLPLYERYGEWLEQDFDALRLAITLDNGASVAAAQLPTTATSLTASVWTGLFTRRDGAMRFRNGLAHAYFKRSFLERPERIISCYVRNQQYASAIRFLDVARDNEPNRLSVFESIGLAWIRDTNTPSLAWQAVAAMLHRWFGAGAQVYRYHAQEQSAARHPDSYYLVVPDGLEIPASAEIQHALKQAHRDQNLELSASHSDCVQGPIALTGADGRWAFRIRRDEREHGAIVWTNAIQQAEGGNKSTLEFWTRCFNGFFKEIVRFEQDVLSDIDIARIQRIAQEQGGAEHVDGVLRIILTALTARFGLQFHRAAILQTSSARQLRGRVAIGHHSQSDAHTAWRRIKPFALADVLKLSAARLSTLPDDELTPLDKRMRDTVIQDWKRDALLSNVLSGDIPVVISLAQIRKSDSALRTIMQLDDAHGTLDGKDNPVLVVPIRDGASGALTGALIVDRPFDHGPVTQEHVDLLPQFAAQLALVLQNEEAQRRRMLFDAFGGFSTQRWSLQQTLDAIADAILKHFRGRVAQVMVSIWENSYGDDPMRPNRRQSALRVARRESGDTLPEWHYAYYGADTTHAGCVDSALFLEARALHVPDLPIWHLEHGVTQPEKLFDGIRSVFSCALNSEDSAIPRGVLSFQSTIQDAFTQADLDAFRMIAQRATNVIEKARSFEGLSRARRNTRQLNRAMHDLLQQTTISALHSKILTRAQDLFMADLRKLDGQRKIDSAVLLAMEGSDVAFRLDGKKSALMAEQLAHSCNQMRRAATRNKFVFVEHASAELLARETFGERECELHRACGAEASAWALVGKSSDMLLVLAWKKPRRMNNTERTALPLFTEIAARTNGVIEQERTLMRKQLETSLSVDDYALIEAEYTHQWNKRVRTMRRNAQYARELLDRGAPAAADLEKLRGFLSKIERTGEEGINRMGVVDSLRRSDPISVKPWLADYVQRWNILQAGEAGDIICRLETSLSDDQSLVTRPVILSWILHELLLNARDAELTLPAYSRNLMIQAGYDRQRKGFEISVLNNKAIPREDLEAMRMRSPLTRDNNSGRGVWIAGGQVKTLLGGVLSLPGLEDEHTKFTIFLPDTP